MPFAAGTAAAAAGPPMTPGDPVTVALAALGAVTLINVVLLAVWGYRRLFLGKPTFRPSWSYLDLWLLAQVVLFLLALVLGPLYALHATARDPAALVSAPTFIVPALLLQNLVFFGVPAALIRWKYRLPLREIGLPRLPRRRDVLLGVGLGLAAVIVSLPLEAGLTAVAEHFRYLPWVAQGLRMDASQPVTPLVASMTRQGWGVLLLGFLTIGPAPALGEEMLFRGFLFSLLRVRLGLWPGIVLSGLFFALAHGYFVGFAPVFLLGMGLALVYRRTGSLWTGILLHATNNGAQVLLAFFFPTLLGHH